MSPSSPPEAAIPRIDFVTCTRDELIESYTSLYSSVEKLGELLRQSTQASHKLSVALYSQREEMLEIREWLARQTWRDTTVIRRQADQSEEQAAQATRFQLAMDASVNLVHRLDDNIAYFVKGRDKAEKKLSELRAQLEERDEEIRLLQEKLAGS
ncbi:unnamed protein product [Peniophora sp. CBMAI 1063]|nr:unnamed protein product [Peniophora sp. CBMAI 1063]